MTRFEKLREMSLEEVGDKICEFFCDNELCCRCVANKQCRKSHRGTYEWLKEEIHEG